MRLAANVVGTPANINAKENPPLVWQHNSGGKEKKEPLHSVDGLCGGTGQADPFVAEELLVFFIVMSPPSDSVANFLMTQTEENIHRKYFPCPPVPV